MVGSVQTPHYKRSLNLGRWIRPMIGALTLAFVLWRLWTVLFVRQVYGPETWMRFAISGQPAKSEGAEPAPAVKETGKNTTKEAATEPLKDAAPETKEVAGETKEPAEKTNDSTKIEASTGS